MSGIVRSNWRKQTMLQFAQLKLDIERLRNSNKTWRRTGTSLTEPYYIYVCLLYVYRPGRLLTLLLFIRFYDPRKLSSAVSALTVREIHGSKPMWVFSIELCNMYSVLSVTIWLQRSTTTPNLKPHLSMICDHAVDSHSFNSFSWLALGHKGARTPLPPRLQASHLPPGYRKLSFFSGFTSYLRTHLVHSGITWILRMN